MSAWAEVLSYVAMGVVGYVVLVIFVGKIIKRGMGR